MKTPTNIHSLTWQAFQDGELIKARPRYPYHNFDWESLSLWQEEHRCNIFIAIGLEANKTYQGSELELVWQQKGKHLKEWLDDAQNLSDEDVAILASNHIECRQILRIKSSIADAEKPYKVGDWVNIEKAEWEQTENGLAKVDIVGQIISVKDGHSHPNVHDYFVQGKTGGHYINHSDKRLTKVNGPKEVNHPVETDAPETLAQAVETLLQKGSLKRDERAQSIYYLGAQFGYKFAKKELLSKEQIQWVLDCIWNTDEMKHPNLSGLADDIYNKQFNQKS